MTKGIRNRGRRVALGAAVVLGTASFVGPNGGVHAGTNLGAGAVSGSVTIAGAGIPVATATPQPTSFTIDPGASATGVVFNTVITGHVGTMTLTGSGSTQSENTLTATGTSLTVTADGTGPTGSRITCASLTGNFLRVAAVVEVNVVGGCTVNNFGTGTVRFLATLAFTPTAGDGINTRITKGAFTGTFEIIPA